MSESYSASLEPPRRARSVRVVAAPVVSHQLPARAAEGG